MVRSRTIDIAISSWVKPLVIFYIDNIRDMLLHGREIELLWVNKQASAMERKSFSKEMLSLIRAFNPLLSCGPLGFRRCTVTSVFGQKINTGDLSMMDFFNKLVTYMNVNPITAE